MSRHLSTIDNEAGILIAPGLACKTFTTAFQDTCAAFSVSNIADSRVSAINELDEILDTELSEELSDTTILQSSDGLREAFYSDCSRGSSNYKVSTSSLLHFDGILCYQLCLSHNPTRSSKMMRLQKASSTSPIRL